MKRTLVVSDIHGELYLFEELLNEVNYNHESDQLILLGDYIDRGPMSKDVLNRVIELKKSGAIVLRGNHDDMMIKAAYGELEVRDRWERSGGITTLKSYDQSIQTMTIPNSQIFNEHVEFLKGLDYYYESDDYIFVHAGIQPDTLLHKTDPNMFMWIREEFYQKYEADKNVVFGHTPTSIIQGKGKHGVYFGENNIIGIDGAAAYGGKLNCLELPSKRTYYTSKNQR